MSIKTCCYCYKSFTPHVKVGDRQKCCGSYECKRRRKQEADRNWRKRNPDYFKGRYEYYLKPWLAAHPCYLKEYRTSRNVRNDISYDIQDELTVKKTVTYSKMFCDIQDKLSRINSMSYRVLHDIQDALSAIFPARSQALPEMIYKTR